MLALASDSWRGKPNSRVGRRGQLSVYTPLPPVIDYLFGLKNRVSSEDIPECLTL